MVKTSTDVILTTIKTVNDLKESVANQKQTIAQIEIQLTLIEQRLGALEAVKGAPVK